MRVCLTELNHGVEKKIAELNRQFQEMYEKKVEEEPVSEVTFDEEEHVEKEEDLFDDEADDEEELKKRKHRSITLLSEDEEEGKESSSVKPAQKESSERLTLNKDGKLTKEKPKVSLMDMFKKAKERRKEESSSEIEPEEDEIDKGETPSENDKGETLSENDKGSLENDKVVDENKYEEDRLPTAEDYERYKQMMSESRTHFIVISSRPCEEPISGR